MVHDTAVRIIQYRDARPVEEEDNTVLFVCLFVCLCFGAAMFPWT